MDRKKIEKNRHEIKKRFTESMRSNQEAMSSLMAELGISGDAISCETFEEISSDVQRKEQEQASKNGNGFLGKLFRKK